MKRPMLIGYVLLGALTATATAVVCEVRRRNAVRRLIDAAEQGYETAHDIIYPDKNYSRKRKKLHYGPVV